MQTSLENKSALVMASSNGIGKGIAMEFCREAGNVMLFGRNEERLQQARDEIAAETDNAPRYTVGDLTNSEDIERVVTATVEAYGGLYALINNSGGPKPGQFDVLDDNDWQDGFDLTLLNYVRTTRAAIPYMQKGGGGRIVNIASSSIKSVIDPLLLSNVYRMGMLGFTKSLARQYGKDNIFMNTLGPGKIATSRSMQIDANKAASLGISAQEMQQRNEAGIPVGRYGTTAEFGRMAVFLCSEANGYITGQNFLIDGGMVSAY